MIPLRPGDAVLCIKDPFDPRKRDGVEGIVLPMKGAVYTVEVVHPTDSFLRGGFSVTLVGVRSRGLDRNGDMVLCMWHGDMFKRLPAVNTNAVVQRIMRGGYGEPFDAKAIGLYRQEYFEMVHEAEQHRKAKW